MKQSWVYILECVDGSYYVGCTTNLEKRIAQHHAGTFDGYTAARRPVRLLWSEVLNDVHYAIEAERKLKKWTRAKKEALMRGDFSLLKELAQSVKTKRRLQNVVQPSTLPINNIGIAQADVESSSLH